MGAPDDQQVGRSSFTAGPSSTRSCSAWIRPRPIAVDGFFTSQRMDADGYLQSQITVQFVQRDNADIEDLGGLVPMGGVDRRRRRRGARPLCHRQDAAQRRRGSGWRSYEDSPASVENRLHIDQMEPRPESPHRRAAQPAIARRPTMRPPTMTFLRIRMYNVGFGDCFLLFIPTDDGERTMLLDCGKHMSSTTGTPISEAAKDVVQSVSGAARQATHRRRGRHPPPLRPHQRLRPEAVGEGRSRRGLDAVDGRGAIPPPTRFGAARTVWRVRLSQRFTLARHYDRCAGVQFVVEQGAETRLRTGFAGQARRRYLPEVDRRPASV